MEFKRWWSEFERNIERGVGCVLDTDIEIEIAISVITITQLSTTRTNDKKNLNSIIERKEDATISTSIVQCL